MAHALPIVVINGPNLNMLGLREPDVYGSATLGDIEKLCTATASAHSQHVVFFQSNHEGALIDRIQQARTDAAAIVINPAGYSHTSVALRDALAAADVPVVEVHISNIHRREDFRHHSFVSAVSVGVIAGLGIQGYAAALTFLCASLVAPRTPDPVQSESEPGLPALAATDRGLRS
ncbi:type II 3-dehydroquinate dehydratase [Nakamurella antarctica]|uniref:3-dehydroquinate dehydratase n=1 Tax=Nakamurella antarctica TaxID=1902245 RepID=A0A3G8ZNE6_9ACTN|nr:type II 3-dehydroquinate dehydratase [Nakamurella antarctica]AZI58327.1 type II 3-dehydroquinate dehydratase [Nakamurella antarctica]